MVCEGASKSLTSLTQMFLSARLTSFAEVLCLRLLAADAARLQKGKRQVTSTAVNESLLVVIDTATEGAVLHATINVSWL